MRKEMCNVGAIQRHAAHGRNDADVGSAPLSEGAQPMLALLGLCMFQRNHPLNTGLVGQGFKLMQILKGIAVQSQPWT